MKRLILVAAMAALFVGEAEARERKRPLLTIGKAVRNLVLRPAQTIKDAAKPPKCADGHCAK